MVRCSTKLQAFEPPGLRLSSTDAQAVLWPSAVASKAGTKAGKPCCSPGKLLLLHLEAPRTSWDLERRAGSVLAGAVAGAIPMSCSDGWADILLFDFEG